MSKYLLFPSLLFLALLTACGTDQTTTIASTATVQPRRSTAPALTRKPVTNTLAATSGPTLLGSPLSAFVGRYGQPNDHSDAGHGTYHFARFPGSGSDSIIAEVDIFDGGQYAQRVMGIDTGPNPGQNWTVSQANMACTVFLPIDAQYKRTVQLSDGNGYDRIYSSVSLAHAFPADAFTDDSNNPTTPGLADVQFLTNSDGSVGACSIHIGTLTF